MAEPNDPPVSRPPESPPPWTETWSSPAPPEREQRAWAQPPAPMGTQRNPVPQPAAQPRVLRLEVALVLLLAFAPGLLGLLLIALGQSNSSGTPGKLVPAIVSGIFDLFLSWSPVLLIGYLLVRSGEGGAGIGLGRFQAAADGLVGLGLWVASFVLVLLLSGIFSSFGERQVDFLPVTLPLWFRIVDALVIATTAGLTEEIVVRGYAQTRLEQLGAPAAVVILLPTGMWGLLHLYEGLGAALTILGLGLMYALFYHRTRRLWPLIIAHGMFDLTQLTILLSTHR